MSAADPLSDLLVLLKPQAYGFCGLDVGGAWSLLSASVSGESPLVR
jgi:hypothetical protein